jgi:hypothetical protein
MAFAGTEPIRAKIIVAGETINQANTFKYLDCEIPYRNKRYRGKKLSFLLFWGHPIIVNMVVIPGPLQQIR